jgi:hypothetical protein
VALLCIWEFVSREEGLVITFDLLSYVRSHFYMDNEAAIIFSESFSFPRPGFSTIYEIDKSQVR